MNKKVSFCLKKSVVILITVGIYYSLVLPEPPEITFWDFVTITSTMFLVVFLEEAMFRFKGIKKLMKEP